MSEFSRRVFLKGGTAAIVAAGAVSALPGLSGTRGRRRHPGAGRRRCRRGRGRGRRPDRLDWAARSSPTSGTSPPGRSVCSRGTDEITVHDPQLAASILRAMR